AAANRGPHRSQAGAPDRILGIGHDLRMEIDDLLHVAVLLPDVHPVAGMRIVRHDVAHDVLEQRLLLPPALLAEIADDE
ncbi:hypothetical protein FE80_14700, partial [Staphylococcus aureus]